MKDAPNIWFIEQIGESAAQNRIFKSVPGVGNSYFSSFISKFVLCIKITMIAFFEKKSESSTFRLSLLCLAAQAQIASWCAPQLLGCRTGFVACKVQTRNNCGISKNQVLHINFGSLYDFAWFDNKAPDSPCHQEISWPAGRGRAGTVSWFDLGSCPEV